MSETVAELAATDALLTALSRGDVGRTGDPVLDALSGWVGEITSHPVPRFELELPEFYARETGGRAWRVAASAVVVAAMSSGGIAAAATGDPLAPFNYVATALGHLAPADPGSTRFGSQIIDGIERDPAKLGQDVRAHATGSSTYGPVAGESHGRHRAPERQPRHRAADDNIAEAPEQATDTGYTPRHVASDDVATDAPSETPTVENPPVVTPVPETPAEPTSPPASEPAPEPEPQPNPSDGPVVATPAPTESAPTGGSDATGSGAAGSDATGAGSDLVQVKMSEDAPVETPGDQGTSP